MSHPILNRLEKFQNRPNQNKTKDDSFIARGYHLELIREVVNNLVDQHPEYYTGSLTDNNPTDAEIEAIVGTAEELGEGFTAYIKDTTGSGRLYLVITDGTDWFFQAYSPTLT